LVDPYGLRDDTSGSKRTLVLKRPKLGKELQKRLGFSTLYFNDDDLRNLLP